jgi:hypothetical protein
MGLGTAVHTAVLEGRQKLAADYLVADDCCSPKKTGERCDNAGKWYVGGGRFKCGQHAKAHEEDLAGRTIIGTDDMAAAEMMAERIENHEGAALILKRSKRREVSLVWLDERTGVKLKCRIDLISDDYCGVLGDIKTTRDASKEAFELSIIEYGYHRQGALYIDAAAANGLPHNEFRIIAVENCQPYCCATYLLDDPSLYIARTELAEQLDIYKFCSETGVWPGYSGKTQKIGLPAWAISKHLQKKGMIQ